MKGGYNGFFSLQPCYTFALHNVTLLLCNKQLLGLEKELGSIEIGKIGDFVVLEDSPFEDISNLEKIIYVIKDGIIEYSNRSFPI